MDDAYSEIDEDLFKFLLNIEKKNNYNSIEF